MVAYGLAALVVLQELLDTTKTHGGNRLNIALHVYCLQGFLFCNSNELIEMEKKRLCLLEN